LLDALIADVRDKTGVMVRLADFKLETLSAHHFMNFKVVDEHGRQLDMGRNLAALQAELGAQAREQFQRIAEQVSPITGDAADADADSGGDAREASAAGAGKAGTRSTAGAARGANPSGKPAAGAGNMTAVDGSAYTNLTTWSFGELPELLEIQRGRQTLLGFPALVDKGTHCDIEVFDDPNEAAEIHQNGLRRLFALQLKEQLKYLEKNVPGLQQMGMQFMALGAQEELREQIIQAGLSRACLQPPLPKNPGEFNVRRDEGKARLNLLVNEIARLVGQVLAEYHALPKKLQGIKSNAAVFADMQAQLQALVHKRFVAETPHAQLSHFPRYLKAMTVRIDKLRSDPARDTRLMADWQQAAAPWQRALKGGSRGDPRMDEYRWLLEELRVSLYAQELRTPMPVSTKRLQKVWESMQR
jgi:ATP-dependent helicase HrpA